MRMASGSYEGPYSFESRFVEGNGTNPEGLIAAAHAGCFSDVGFTITRIELDTEARVPGIEESEFQEKAGAFKAGRPVSQALAAVDVMLSAKLAA